jgi:single-strand DNA-binding protein
VNEGWGDKQTVSYVDLTLWNQSARFAAQYLSKGSNVLVEGRLKQDRWETEDGKRSKHKVVVDILRSLDKKGDNPQATTEEKPAPVQADSVPF